MRLSKFEYQSDLPGEMDFLIVLPDMKIFINVEVKAKMNDQEKLTHMVYIDGNLRSAAKQTHKHAMYTSQIHGSIISEQWRFIKVAAIIPNVDNLERVCDHCKKFVITNAILEAEGGLSKWWNDTGIFEGVEKIDAIKHKSYKEFLNIFNRIVNLSAMAKQQVVSNAWKQIVGETIQYDAPITAGWTKTSDLPATQLNIGDAIARPHDAYKILYFNADQYSLLQTNKLLRVLFFCDFGSGKL